MRKKAFLLPLLALTMGLGSCAQSQEEALSTLAELTQNISDPAGEYDYTAEISGFIGTYWNSECTYSNYFSMEYSMAQGTGVSALLGLPGIVTASNFETVYEEYQSVLVDSRNYSQFVQVRSNDIGGFDMYVSNSDVTLAIYGIGGTTNDGHSLNPNVAITATARFDVCYTFDSKGFLTTESINLVETHTSAIAARMSLTATYPEF